MRLGKKEGGVVIRVASLWLKRLSVSRTLSKQSMTRVCDDKKIWHYGFPTARVSSSGDSAILPDTFDSLFDQFDPTSGFRYSVRMIRVVRRS